MAPTTPDTSERDRLFATLLVSHGPDDRFGDLLRLRRELRVPHAIVVMASVGDALSRLALALRPLLMKPAQQRASFPSIAEAVAALEAGVGRFLLAVQEEGIAGSNTPTELSRVRRRLYELQQARALASELAASDGRPCLTVVEGTR